MRHHRYWVIGAVAVVAILAFVGFEFVTAPRIGAISPQPGTSLARAALVVSVDVPGAEHLHGLSVSLDGRDVTPSVRSDADHLYFSTGHLAQGAHSVTLSARTSNVLRPRLRKAWRFTVDTVAPTVHLRRLRPDAVATVAPLPVAGRSEPGARLEVSGGATTSKTTVAGDGSFATTLALPDGPATLTVTATDAAGNTFVAHRHVLVDATAPELDVTGLKKVSRSASPKAHVKASDAAGAPRVKIRLDGDYILDQKARYLLRIPLEKLAEGVHAMVVTATDPGRHVTVVSRRFLVNSTEKLGKATLIAGARGRDVKDLQRKLRTQGVYEGPITGVLDKRTERAVRRFQEKIDIPADGVVGPMMLGGLTGRIVVIQHEHRLYFYQNGELKKSYPVATGQAAYPTPNGTTTVTWMTKNPTWTPPDSPWAQGAKPVAPGPDNPVGMRWIGTGFSGVGIHGVPSSEDYSIGTYASHGCIRMYEWDVEELYNWVTPGMPIIIQP